LDYSENYTCRGEKTDKIPRIYSVSLSTYILLQIPDS
jgi:hypothetical protein